MNHNSGKKKHEGKSDWSTLPDGILHIIVGKLQHYGDRLRLASVCKDWRIPVAPPRPQPWVVMVNLPVEHVFTGNSRSVTITLEFHETGSKVNEPCNLKPYKRSFEIANSAADPFFGDPKPEDPQWAFFLHARQPSLTTYSDDHVFLVTPSIQESKFGWLVVSMFYTRYIGEDYYHRFLKSFFVCNPFSARFMRLPDLPQEHLFITFSGSDPTSQECVFFLLVDQRGSVSIQTWNPGQDVWKERYTVAGTWGGENLVRGAVWFDGIFYWCSRTHMESFNPSNGGRKVMAFPFYWGGIEFRFAAKLLEMNGKIILLVHSIEHTERYNLLFMYDPFEDFWTRRDELLNDRVLYVSSRNPHCCSIVVAGEYENTGWNRVIRNFAFSYDCKDYEDLDEDDKSQNLDLYKPLLTWLAPP